MKCLSKYRCRTCDQKHHTLLHQNDFWNKRGGQTRVDVGMVEISNDDISSTMIECDNINHRNIVKALAINLRNPKVRLDVVAVELRNLVNNRMTQIYMHCTIQVAKLQC